MAAVKPDKIRMETYDRIRCAVESKYGITPLGKSNEGLVYENHVDGEQIVIKVIRKKNPYAICNLESVLSYGEQLLAYEENKKNKG